MTELPCDAPEPHTGVLDEESHIKYRPDAESHWVSQLVLPELGAGIPSSRVHSQMGTLEYRLERQVPGGRYRGFLNQSAGKR